MKTTVCQNCSNVFTGNYCNNCGQKIYSQNDKKISSIVNEAFHFITHFEGSVFNTFKTVLLQPGKLTVDYCNGIRKKYYKPISFFLLLIVIYLLFPYMEGLNMRLEYYKGTMFTGTYFDDQIAQKLAELRIPESELAEIFHHKSEKIAKVLLLLLLPFTAIVLYALGFRNRKAAFDYFIGATEINIFYVLFFFLILPIPLRMIVWLFDIEIMPESYFLPVILVLFVLWQCAFMKRFFEKSWLISIVAAMIMIVCHVLITQVIYKTLLFEITMSLI